MIALRIYLYFQRNRVLLFAIVIAALLATTYFGTKIKLEADINKFIPKDKKIDEINFVLQNLKIKDKLVLTIYNTDSTNKETSDLMLCADALADTLQATHVNGYIKELTYKVSDDLMAKVYDTFYDHLPIFLEETDYQKIEGFLNPDSLKDIIKNDYKIILYWSDQYSKEIKT